MKNHLFLIFLSISYALSGCRPATDKQPSPHVLDFDKARTSPQEVKLSTIASSLSFIPLETTDSLLLAGNLGTVIAGSYILVYDV